MERYKIVLVGDSGVGKTSLFVRYSDDKYAENSVPTVGIDFRFKKVGKLVELQIWDTAGNEHLRLKDGSHYRGANAIMFTYDISNKQSFDNLTTWLEEAQKYTDSSVLKILVGTKSDRTADRQVTPEEAAALGGIDHRFETSALNGENVDKVFESIAHWLSLSRLPRPSVLKMDLEYAQPPTISIQS